MASSIIPRIDEADRKLLKRLAEHHGYMAIVAELERFAEEACEGEYKDRPECAVHHQRSALFMAREMMLVEFASRVGKGQQILAERNND
jgi:hypothetical protein